MRTWIGIDKGSIDSDAAAEGGAIMTQFHNVGSKRSDGSKGRNQGSERRARQSSVYSARTAEKHGA